VRDCVRLKNAGMGRERFVPRRRGVIDGTADASALRGWEAAGIAWPLADLTDAMLEQRRFANTGVKSGRRHHGEPDWASVLPPCSFRTFGEFRVHPATS
jgi:hypothetical protein